MISTRPCGALLFVAMLLTVPMAHATPTRDERTRETVQSAPVEVPGSGLRDEAAMVLVGTVLIGVAAVVRRAGVS